MNKHPVEEPTPIPSTRIEVSLNRLKTNIDDLRNRIFYLRDRLDWFIVKDELIPPCDSICIEEPEVSMAEACINSQCLSVSNLKRLIEDMIGGL